MNPLMEVVNSVLDDVAITLDENLLVCKFQLQNLEDSILEHYGIKQKLGDLSQFYKG